MATPCFCGHDHPVKGIRLRAANEVGGRMEADLRVFSGALGDGLAGDSHDEVAELVRTGPPLLEEISAVVHGGDRPDGFKQRVTGWMDRANAHRGAMESAVRDAGFVGVWFRSAGERLYGGVRADGVVLAVRDTGATVNNDPRVELTIRVHPADGEPFEVSRTMLVPRVNLPRPNESVEVAYDPEDPAEFVFRLKGATTEPASADGTDPDDDRLEQLERLASLRDRGVLSDAEFRTEKRRILGP